MSLPNEDAATVLEMFINDVSNLPAEIAHLYTELQARDVSLKEHRDTYLARDASLQKHIRLHGSHAENPKEAAYVDQIRKNQRRALELQDEKITHAQRVLDLIDKHSRRLDANIANLVRDGLMPAEALTPAPPPSNLPAASQMVRQQGGSIRANPSILGIPGSLTAGVANSSSAAAARRGVSPNVPQTPAAQREPGPVNKRTKVSVLPLDNLPAVPSGLGGKPNTPGSLIRAEASRAGTPSGHSGTRMTWRKKPPVKRGIGAVLMDEGDEEEDGVDEEAGEGDGDGEGDDKRLYCLCQQVSYGSMVGCDDKDCPFEWFHWGCVGLTEEPKGKWYCPSCSAKRSESREFGNRNK